MVSGLPPNISEICLATRSGCWITVGSNATEKLGPTLVFYDVIPVSSFDTPELMRRRLRVMTRFAEEVKLNPVKSILAGSKNCMEGI